MCSEAGSGGGRGRGGRIGERRGEGIEGNRRSRRGKKKWC